MLAQDQSWNQEQPSSARLKSGCCRHRAEDAGVADEMSAPVEFGDSGVTLSETLRAGGGGNGLDTEATEAVCCNGFGGAVVAHAAPTDATCCNAAARAAVIEDDEAECAFLGRVDEDWLC